MNPTSPGPVKPVPPRVQIPIVKRPTVLNRAPIAPKPNLKLAKAPDATNRKVAKRWTSKLVADGWTPVSDYFLKNYHRLSPPITTSEAMLIIHLMLHKWGEEAPFPAFKTLAKRMGISATAVRGHARNLEIKKHIRREKRINNTNLFYLDPLFANLEKMQALDKANDTQRGTKRARATG